jgi:hypothetical protein
LFSSLGYVQLIGREPGEVAADKTQLYSLAALLQAAVWILSLLQSSSGESLLLHV